MESLCGGPATQWWVWSTAAGVVKHTRGWMLTHISPSPLCAPPLSVFLPVCSSQTVKSDVYVLQVEPVHLDFFLVYFQPCVCHGVSPTDWATALCLLCAHGPEFCQRWTCFCHCPCWCVCQPSSWAWETSLWRKSSLQVRTDTKTTPFMDTSQQDHGPRFYYHSRDMLFGQTEHSIF